MNIGEINELKETTNSKESLLVDKNDSSSINVHESIISVNSKFGNKNNQIDLAFPSPVLEMKVKEQGEEYKDPLGLGITTERYD